MKLTHVHCINAMHYIRNHRRHLCQPREPTTIEQPRYFSAKPHNATGEVLEQRVRSPVNVELR